MIFALDTNPCIKILRASDANVLKRYRSFDPASIVLPALVAGELMVGALKSVRPRALQELELFLSAHEIVAFDEDDFRIYAKTRVDLERSGLKIGDNDTIIAATALRIGATLVTHNVREFSRIPDLSIVDWEA